MWDSDTMKCKDLKVYVENIDCYMLASLDGCLQTIFEGVDEISSVSVFSVEYCDRFSFSNNPDNIVLGEDKVIDRKGSEHRSVPELFKLFQESKRGFIVFALQSGKVALAVQLVFKLIYAS